MEGDLSPADLGIGELFHVVRDAVIVADADTGRVALWNAAAEELFGFPATEAVGMSLERLVPDDLRELHRAGLERYRTTRTGPLVDSATVVELPALRRDGSRAWVELRLSPLTNTHTPGCWVLAIVRDVSSRHAERDALAASNQSMRSFLSAVAHDVRGPLTVISGAAQIVATADLDDIRRRALQSISRQAEVIDRLADDLSSAAQLEAGSVRPRTAAVDVADVAGDVVATSGRSVEVRAPSATAALADPDHVRRIVANLVSNAIKYGAEPYVVTVTSTSDEVVITVSDHGPGVPDALRARLFTRFWRNPDHDAHPGLGLGLTIVHGLAEANGGRAWYEAGPAGGACFAVALPAAPAS